MRSRSKIRIKSLALAALAVWLVLLAPVTTPAATYTWTGAGFFGDQDYLWSNPFNWLGGAAPTAGETNVVLVFPDSAAPKVTTNDIAGLNVAALHFEGTNYVVHGYPGGNVLGLKGNPGSNWLVTVLQGNQVSSDTRNRFASDCSLSFKTHGTWNGIGDFVLNSSISGPGGITVIGGGWLDFDAGEANSFLGTTHVKDGGLYLAKSGGLGGQGAVCIPGPLIIGETNGEYGEIGRVYVLRRDTIASNVPVTVHSSSHLWLGDQTNTLASLTLGKGAEVLVNYPSSYYGPGMLHLKSGVTNLATGNSPWVATIEGNIDLATTQNFEVAAGAYLVLKTSISGNGGLTKTGGGTMQFWIGTNTYNGPTVIHAGTVELLGAAAKFGSTASGTTINAGATVELHSVQIGQEALTVHGSINDSSLLVLGSGPSLWAGPITLNGECSFYCSDGQGSGAALTLSGAITGSGSLRKKGYLPLYLAGSLGNNFTGGLVVEAGVVHLNKSANDQAFGGPLTIGVSDAYSAGVLVEQSNQIPNYVPITIRKTGYLDSAAGANDTVGDLELYGGHLRGNMFTLSGNLTNHWASGTGTIENAVALTADTHVFHCDASAPLQVDGAIQGAASLIKTGPGRLTFTAANTYTGFTWVRGGDLRLANLGRPGTSAGGTTMDAGTTLVLDHRSITNETLTLSGTNADGESVCSEGTNHWTGPIELAADAAFATTNQLTLHGEISGAGGLTFTHGHYNGPGVLELAGTSANTYAGLTKVEGGTLRLNKTGPNAVPGGAVVGPSDVTCSLSLAQANQISDFGYVTIQAGHSLVLNGNAETIGALDGAGAVNLGLGTLTTGGAGYITTFSGLIHGNGGLTKTGGGNFTLTANNLYTGTTTVNGGKLIVNGLQPQSPVSLLTGGSLGGTGRVGNISDNSGHVAPGSSPGILVCSNYSTFSPANQLQIEINGTAPGGGHDQLKVNGSVLLMGGTLQVAMNYAGAISNQYVLVSNDAADPVSGTFTGLPNGATLTNHGAVFQITYQGGDGNDIALIQKSLAYYWQIVSGTKLANGHFALTGLGAPNLTYRVWAATNLNAPITWTWISMAAANAAGQIQFTDTSAPQYPMRFYRFSYP